MHKFSSAKGKGLQTFWHIKWSNLSKIFTRSNTFKLLFQFHMVNPRWTNLLLHQGILQIFKISQFGPKMRTFQNCFYNREKGFMQVLGNIVPSTKKFDSQGAKFFINFCQLPEGGCMRNFFLSNEFPIFGRLVSERVMLASLRAYTQQPIEGVVHNRWINTDWQNDILSPFWFKCQELLCFAKSVEQTERHTIG